jgi:histidyl-tRNA synthetase
VIGEDEIKSQTLTVKSLRTEEEQTRLSEEQLVEYIKRER